MSSTTRDFAFLHVRAKRRMAFKRVKGRRFEGAHERLRGRRSSDLGLGPRPRSRKEQLRPPSRGQTRAGLSAAGQRMAARALKAQAPRPPTRCGLRSRVTGRTLGECIRELPVAGRPQTEEGGEYAATGSIGQVPRSSGRASSRLGAVVATMRYGVTNAAVTNARRVAPRAKTEAQAKPSRAGREVHICDGGVWARDWQSCGCPQPRILTSTQRCLGSLAHQQTGWAGLDRGLSCATSRKQIRSSCHFGPSEVHGQSVLAAGPL